MTVYAILGMYVRRTPSILSPSAYAFKSLGQLKYQIELLPTLRKCFILLVWCNRIRRLATDQVVMRLSPATNIYVMHCWLISPNKVNLLSWLLAYLCC